MVMEYVACRWCLSILIECASWSCASKVSSDCICTIHIDAPPLHKAPGAGSQDGETSDGTKDTENVDRIEQVPHNAWDSFGQIVVSAGDTYTLLSSRLR